MVPDLELRGSIMIPHDLEEGGTKATRNTQKWDTGETEKEKETDGEWGLSDDSCS